MYWGLSEALDLLNEYKKSFTTQKDEQNVLQECLEMPQSKNEINILLFGANDPRHLIRTMSKMHQHRSEGMIPYLNFYLVDGCIEVVARNIILLAIALEDPEILNLRSKVHLFMDIYGNSLIKASSYHYLVAKAKTLIKAITDDEYLKVVMPMLNIERMKYRDRDGLENTFNFWLSKELNIFNIQEYWNIRLRKLLTSRYDHRDGQFDWDLNMILKERGGTQICSQEYRYWRETGIAFTFPEYEYSKPNKTMTAGLVRNGDKYFHRGYVGDIQTGPFAAYGLRSNDERMHKSLHGENDFRSTDVTERNLLEYFYELTTQNKYEHNETMTHKYGAVRLQMGKRLTHDSSNLEETQDYNKPWTYVEGIKINLLSCDDVLTLQNIVNEQWRNFFDIVFVGHNYFPFLRDNFVNVLSSQALLILETKLLSTARKEDIHSFEEKLFNYAKQINVIPVINYNSINGKNSILKFKRDSNKSK